MNPSPTKACTNSRGRHLCLPLLSLSKKPRRVCRRWRQIESNPFSAGACTWQKTLLRLQVWNLSPIGGQIMRAAGCQSLSEKPKGVFRQSQQREAFMPPSAAYMEPFPTMARQKHPPGHFRPGGCLCVGRSAGFMPFPGSRSCRPGCGSADGLRSGLRLRRSCSPPGSRPSGPLPRRFWE